MKIKVEVIECEEKHSAIGFEQTLNDAQIFFYRKCEEAPSEIPEITPDIRPVGEVMALITSNIPNHILQQITNIMSIYVNGEI